jgi:hypothetical protein
VCGREGNRKDVEVQGRGKMRRDDRLRIAKQVSFYLAGVGFLLAAQGSERANARFFTGRYLAGEERQ